jgi:hypothetical protein
MATQKVLWTAGTSRTTGISGVTINNGAGSLGSEIDNGTNKDQFVSLDLAFTAASAPTAGSPWYVYVLYAIDGTDYEDGGASTQPSKTPVATFGAPADTSAHRRNQVNIPLAPFKLKLLVWNATGQNSASNAVTLLAYSHNDDVQAAA